MKKYISALLAAAMMLSIAGCSGDQNVSNDSAAGSTAEAGASLTAEAGTVTDGTEATEPLSIPVAMVDGDVDMEKALAYQTDMDALVASLEAKAIDPTKPVSENSNEDTLAVFDYLCSIYGKQVLSCQQMMGIDCHEDLVFYNATGDLPAMKGYDFIFNTGAYVSDDMVNEAIEWHNESGGLVTFTWHWNVPRDIDNLDMGYAFYQEEILNWSQVNAVTPGTKEYEQVIHDIDLIASKLQVLEEAGVTVLFRPLHEASGSWFWWGIQDRSTAENQVFQKLWYMIFDRIENYHKLTNVIWVWNGQSKHCMVHPNSYDIAGIDYYANEADHTAMTPQYNKLEGMNADSGKMLALSECGYMPDPDDCKESGSMWLYYMIWNGEFVCEVNAAGAVITDFDGTPSPNPERMTTEMLQQYFGSENIVTYKDLPARFIEGKDIPSKIKTWEYFKIG